MQIKLNVEGMTCSGCENRVKNVLSDFKEIASVNADHTKNEVVIELKEEIDTEAIKKAIEDLGFTVKE